jgi:hypothetical protein
LPQTFADPTAFRADYDRLVAFETGDKVRRSTLPPSPNDYKAELPADFKVPDGMKYEFKPDDPLLYQARQLFHDIDQGKISGQDAFSKALGLFAAGQVSSAQQIQNGQNAEIAKLGANGPTRVAALRTFWRAYLGEAAGERRFARVWTAQDVIDAEMEVSKITSQGAALFRGSGREPPQQAGRVSDEQFARMNDRDRLDYTRQFKQSEMPPWRDPRG